MYSYERELAFFVVNFHMSKRDFDELTEKEKLFIRKEWENKVIFESTMTRNAALNAIANANRKKNSRFIELHKKKRERANKEFNTAAIVVITQTEEREGKGWVDEIYKANGLRRQE
ncbi:hypothetical protein ERICI_02994 [Paenibacillus larvae subsp. larvae]|nr:phenylalanine racemase [Paenibacillus larvae subsp. larvae]AVF22804.1 hypothetical protein ERICI_02994 [Paenibacillus larvae subsp. larvae]ETK26539.1 phage protein [Paenibacillus larvae subsp. larvae DSM 25719]